MKLRNLGIAATLVIVVFAIFACTAIIERPEENRPVGCNDIQLAQEQIGDNDIPTNCVDLPDGGFARAETILSTGPKCPSPLTDAFETTSVRLGETLQMHRIVGATPEELQGIISETRSLAPEECITSFDYVIDGDGDSTFGSPGLELTGTVESDVGYIPGTQRHVLDLISATTNNEYIQGSSPPVRVYVFDTFCTGYEPGLPRNDYSQAVNQHAHEPQKCTHGQSVTSLAMRVAPSAEYVGVRVLDHNGAGYLGGLLQALDDIGTELQQEKQRPAVVLNFSLGIRSGPSEATPDNHMLTDSYLMQFLCKLATEPEDCTKVPGVALVAAAGNTKANHPDYPAAHALFVSVAATVGDGSGLLASYSNPGDIAAPGGDSDNATCGSSANTCIVVANSNSDSSGTHWDNALWAGTSFASPLAAGTAALILEINPSLTPLEVKQLLIDSADPAMNHSLNVGNTLANTP